MIHEFPLDSPRVRDIPIDHDLDFDTHSTGGEHALKESGSWREFEARLADIGGTLPDGIEDPFDYYLFNEGGDFYRSYVRKGQYGDRFSMVAGVAASRMPGRGLKVDALYAPNSGDLADNTIVASGVARMFTRNVFSQYSGIRYPGFGILARAISTYPLKIFSMPCSPIRKQMSIA